MIPDLATDSKRLQRVWNRLAPHHLVHKCRIQCPLKRRHLHQHNVLLLVWQRLLQHHMRPPLHKPDQQRVQDMRTVSHQLDVVFGRVDALAVLDGALKHVAKLGFGAEVVGTNKVNHAPVLHEVVLEGVTGQDNAALRAHLLQGLGDGGVRVFDAVAFVADDQVGARVH